ncbi:MAG: rhomboid family intramembrane serine protease [Gemmataceae bacterium]|nr:rhomboid family intramembrane serine protease [Gemmata sp.]MDW8196683.1 rhomboid family intramembrane serine protease [Gemmataceae bacterium]
MGIQDRDYYRDGPSLLDRVGQQGATVWLIGITVIVFLLQAITGQPAPPSSPITEGGCYDTRLILHGQIWRLVTSIFLHSGLWHLFFNMLCLYWAGRRLEEIYGARELAAFYLLAGLVANLVNLAVELLNGTNSQALGASGAVLGVLVVFACHFPHQKVLLFFILPMPVWLLVVLFAVLDLVGALGARPNENIGFVVHLAGAGFGFVYYQTGLRLTRFFTHASAWPARPRLRVTVPPEESTVETGSLREPAPARGRSVVADEYLEAQLDAVLEKVAKFGQASLTAEEREILFRASELYKKRRQ